jgi:serpin B
MKIVAPFLFSACAACSANGTHLASPIDLASPGAHAAAESIDAFGRELHARLPKDDNLFYSPTSVAIALAMAEQGARGQTKAQLDAVLHLKAGSNATYSGLQARLDAARDPALAIANRIYADGRLAIEPSFAQVAPTDTVDFVHDAEGARARINAWVSGGTHERIPELLAPRTVDGSTRLVLVNAVYFKGAWATAFDPRLTRPDVFHGASDVQVPMMHQALSGSLGSHGGGAVLDLPYRSDDGPSVSLVIVVPEEGRTLADVESAYEREGTLAFVSAASPMAEIDVTLPKLKMNVELRLREMLGAMGMPLAFSDQADFSGITRTEPVAISEVIHKAFVDVNEEGTEAAAATGIVAKAGGPPTPLPQFRADRPFLFFLRERDSGVVLFAGRCVDPRS